MNAIKRKNFVLAALTGLGILSGGMLLVFRGAISDSQVQIFLAGTVIAGGVAAVLWLQGLSKLKIARLISDNPILHFSTAVISDLSGEAAQPENIENTEVIISYFGILIDQKIIKLNQDGIRLKAVEIGSDFISLTYGKGQRMQNTRLLCAAIDPAVLEQISERFRYETGITPTLLL